MNKKSETKEKGFLPFIFKTGTRMGNLFLMQILLVVYSLKGGLFLGIFPSIAVMFKVLINWFINQDDLISINTFFEKYWKTFFKTANQVGYALTALFVFLFIDLRINEIFIRSSILHTVLLIVIAVICFLTVYTFPILTGYDLGFKDTIKQAFYVSLSTPVFTTASLLGLMVIYELIKAVPFIGVFFGAPLLILPVAWFTFSGFNKLEELKKEVEAEG